MARVRIDDRVLGLVEAMAKEADRPVETMLNILLLNGLSYTSSIAVGRGRGSEGLHQRIEAVVKEGWGTPVERHQPLVQAQPIT